MTDGSSEIKKRDIPILGMVLSIIGDIGFYAAAANCKPVGYIGDENIPDLQRYMALSAAAQICGTLAICFFILQFGSFILKLYGLEKHSYAVTDDRLPQKRKWLIRTALVLLTAPAVLAAANRISGENGIAARLKIAVFAGADKTADNTVTVTDISFPNVVQLGTGNGENEFGGVLDCVDGDGKVHRMTVSSNEAGYLQSEARKYTDCGFRAVYYRRSGIIKEYSFEGIKHPLYIEDQSDADKTFGQVEISWEVEDDRLLLCRPERLKNNIGWAVYHNGELVQLDPSSPRAYTVTAEYYDKLDIDAHIGKQGSYEIYLVYCTGEKTLRISDSIVFDVNEEWGEPVNIRSAAKKE